MHGPPLTLGFHRSTRYIRAIPPLPLGLLAGLLAAIMGVGGLICPQLRSTVCERLNGETLRCVRGVFIPLAGARFACRLIAPPTELYSIGRAGAT